MQLAAAFDIAQTIYDNFDNNTPVTRRELIGSLKYDRRLSEAIVEKFLEEDIFYIVQEDGRLLPSRPLRHLGSGKIARFILGGTTPNSQGGEESLRAVDAACAAVEEGGFEEE